MEALLDNLRMRTSSVLILVFLIGLPLQLLADEPIKVTISATQKVVSYYQKKLEFRPVVKTIVKANLMNVTKDTIEYTHYNCSNWMNWKTNNEHISLTGGECGKNHPVTTVLKPGESKDDELLLEFGPELKDEDQVNFKMAFLPLVGSGITLETLLGQPEKPEIDNKGLMGTFWSNEISIKILKDKD